MLTGAAVVLVAGGAAGAVAAGAGTYGIYRHKKKQKQNKERHRRMILKMDSQWKNCKDNENISPELFPKVQSEVQEEEAIRLPKTVSFGMGLKEGDNKIDGEQFQMFITALDSHGREIETIKYNKKRSSDLPGVRHSGYHSKPREGRLYSGMPDKQNIVLSFKSIPDTVHSLVVGSIITSKTQILDAYFALFAGKDVDRPKDLDEPAMARYFLDSDECGACNAYIMGLVQRSGDNWMFKPIRAALAARAVADLVPRMQEYVIKTLRVDPEEYSINFSADNEVVNTIWIAYDRYGYRRYLKTVEFVEAIQLEDMITCDSICKIVVVAVNRAGVEFQHLNMDLGQEESESGAVLTIPLSSARFQVACVITAYKPRLNIPFPARPENDLWTVIPYSTPLLCEEEEPRDETIEQLVKERFLPFTGNQIIVELQRGNNMKFAEENLSPRQLKKSDKKNAKLEPVVGILFNDIKIRSNVVKRNMNPEWNQVFQIPLEPDWQITESIVSFKVKDRASKSVIGECGYCIKSLDIPYSGTMFLDNKESSVSFTINVIENEQKLKVSEVLSPERRDSNA